MTTYLKRFITVFAIFFLISIGLSKVVFNGLFYYSNSSYQKIDEMFNNIDDYDAIIIGNSRAHRNIDVKILDSITKKHIYNGGISGAGGFEMFVSLKAFIYQHLNTKTVILNIDNGILNIDKGFFNSSLYINALDNDVIFEAFQEKKYPVLLYKYVPFSKMVEFNDDMRANALNGLRAKTSPSIGLYHGYLPMPDGTINIDTVFGQPKRLIMNEENFMYLDSIVLFCQKNNLNLNFIYSPIYDKHYYKVYSNYGTFCNKIVDNYSKKYKIPLLKFDTLYINFNKKYFWDNIHLNKLGTELFSSELAKILSKNENLLNN